MKNTNEITAETAETTGYIQQSLGRSNAKIRAERGETISEDLEMTYKRAIEDLELDLKKKLRDQKNMFDFSPESSFSLVLAKDVDAKEIKDKDFILGLEIRNINIKLEIAKDRYNFLFIGTKQ